MLRRFVATKTLAAPRAAEALNDLADLGIVRYPHDMLLPRIWELRRNLTAYDGAYVALAEALTAPLLTLDARLGRSSGHRARIELVAP